MWLWFLGFIWKMFEWPGFSPDPSGNPTLRCQPSHATLIHDRSKLFCGLLSVLPDRGWNLPPPLYQFIAKKQFFKYNLGKFLKYITFSSCSSIIFESLPKLYLKICFFSIKCQNGEGNSIHDLGALTFVMFSGTTADSGDWSVLCHRCLYDRI